MKILILFLSLCISSQLVSQLGLQHYSSEAMESYTLFTSDPDSRFEDVHLIDNCGRIINSWLNLPVASNHYKLLPNGNLNWIADEESIMEANWDGDIVVNFRVAGGNLFLDYEVIKLPNGNYLSLGRRTYSRSHFTFSLGYDQQLGDPEFCDIVVEIDKDSGNIVWEWNICDHVIQERDQSKPNYGILSENPQLLDMDAISDYDWDFNETFMINGMDYNPDLDQIALSVRKIGEVAIIDHSTTTDEAKGSSGGKYGKGGDIIFRWGNPQNYGRGTRDDRILYYQHNPNWIKYGPHKGKIIVYNNGLERPVQGFNNRYSSVEIFQPLIDSEGNYIIDDEQPFMPLKSDIEFSKNTVGVDFYSGYESGTQILPNGNLLLSPYSEAAIMEYTLEGELLWRYNTNRLFRTERYPIDYPAFEGKNLFPGEVLWDSGLQCSSNPDEDLDGDGYSFNQGDCNDANPDVNPGVEEIPYNQLDDDCNGDTPDDDLDGDGFPMFIDCDDMNAEVNFFMDEIPYNGLDDDCDENTLDDDLDQDGYLLADDCNDVNELINPSALEIPGNGIDENCDGVDSITNNLKQTLITNVKIYPNPAGELVYIDSEDNKVDLHLRVITVLGEVKYDGPLVKSIDVSSYNSGIYFFELSDLGLKSYTVKRIIVAPSTN